MKYEYITKEINNIGLNRDDVGLGSPQELDLLNKMGSEGWELCGVATRGRDISFYYFKRVKA